MTTIPGPRTPAEQVSGVEHRLTDALRTGPFHLALDLAIDRRGLSLDGLRRRLASHGVTVSQSSVSYWRRGLRRPEGDRSLRAVHALEDVLGLPHQTLSRLLEPRRQRGRWLDHAPPMVGLDTALGIPPGMLATFDGIDIDTNIRLSIVSLHNTAWVGPTGAEESIRVRCVVRSNTDGADRWVCFFDSREPDSGLIPVVKATRSCRPGRIRVDAVHGLLAVELLFDYRLLAGDTYVFEYEIGYPGAAPRTGYHQHGLRTPARDLVMQVRFHQDAIPVRCYGYELLGEDATMPVETNLPIGGSGSVHTVALDAHPGVHGIRWEWD